jgi:hypothetical protein
MNDHTPTARWTVEILLSEHDGQSRAVARLAAASPMVLTGTGLARLYPTDQDVPQIGLELAAGRALHALGDRLLGVATHDIDAATGRHEPVHDRGAWMA